MSSLINQEESLTSSENIPQVNEDNTSLDTLRDPFEDYSVKEAQILVAEVWDKYKDSILNSLPANTQAKDKAKFEMISRDLGLNPMNDEIYLAHFSGENKLPSVFIGRNGYRKIASMHPNYLRHEVKTVYDDDIFNLKTKVSKHGLEQEFEHDHKGGRGKPISGYCTVFFKDGTFKVSIMAYSDVASNKAMLWSKSPITMFEKTVESRGIRDAFTTLLSGTYAEEERDIYRNTEQKSINDKKSKNNPQENEKKEEVDALTAQISPLRVKLGIPKEDKSHYANFKNDFLEINQISKEESKKHDITIKCLNAYLDSLKDRLKEEEIEKQSQELEKIQTEEAQKHPEIIEIHEENTEVLFEVENTPQENDLNAQLV